MAGTEINSINLLFIGHETVTVTHVIMCLQLYIVNVSFSNRYVAAHNGCICGRMVVVTL